ncbi:MAG: hypothetical protein HFJ12_04000 [Bacilli bacterium]|nr:hypothetical protein [Bacilli bacterium]
MNLKFVVNDYVLIWNLLFQASITESIHKLKQKIWINYKEEYNKVFKDNSLMLKDPKNFIPNDDTIYNIVLESKDYEKIKKQTERFRIKLLQNWDENKKIAVQELKDILRFDIRLYHILVVSDQLNIMDTSLVKGSRVNTLVWGKKIEDNNPTSNIINLVYQVVMKELKEYQREYQDIVKAIVELAILNEFATRITGITHYLTGDSTLKYLKRQIYPYWLMYLGVEKDKMMEYMMRDKIGFDISNYTYERQLKKLDLYAFIDFCIRNQKHIVKIDELEII